LYANAALCLHKMGQKSKAHLYCQKARELNPEEIDSYLIEGRIYLGEREFEKGISSWEKALLYDPSANTWYDIATCSLEEGYPSYAKLAFEHIKEEEPDFEGINEKLTAIHLLLDDMENALKYNQMCEHPLELKELERLHNLIGKGDKEELRRIMSEIFNEFNL
ncbi:MAG: hypothetical protein K2I27_09045, partial [Bacteroides sp.]|nr:hypothetical protein [Bacteroides sp.]